MQTCLSPYLLCHHSVDRCDDSPSRLECRRVRVVADGGVAVQVADGRGQVRDLRACLDKCKENRADMLRKNRGGMLKALADCESIGINVSLVSSGRQQQACSRSYRCNGAHVGPVVDA